MSKPFRIAAITSLQHRAGFTRSAYCRHRTSHSSTATSVRQRRLRTTSIGKFGSIDHVVNNAGIFSAKPFRDYTADEFGGVVSTNLEGFIFITQLATRLAVPRSSRTAARGGADANGITPADSARASSACAGTARRPRR